MRVRNDLKLFAACLGAVAVLGGCGGGSLVNGGDVRLVNATSVFASLDLYDGSSKISAGVARSAAGGYVGLDKGSHTFNVADGSTGVTAATLTGNVTKDDHFTIVAYTAGGRLATVFLSDDEGSPSSGTAKLRFFNAATSDVASVDAYLVASACSSLATSFSAPIATAVSGLQATYAQANATAAGTGYHICITTAGDKSDLRLDIPAVTLKDQQILTVILTPTDGGVLLNGLLLNQQSTLTAVANPSARIRVAVGTSSAVPSVSVSASGVSLGSALTAPAVGNYKLVPAGTSVPVNVTIGTSPPTTSTFLVAVAAGADLTLLVTGNGTAMPVLIADDNSASTSTTNPVKLRLVNGMNNLSSSAQLTDDFDNVGEAAALGTSSGYGQVAASSALANLEVVAGTPVCASNLVTLISGGVYTVFLLGDRQTAVTNCTLHRDR
jgi:hypothetical protein